MAFESLINTGIFQLGSMFLRGGSRARLSILIYHRVLAQPDPLRPYEVDIQQFRQQMGLLAQYCRVLSLAEAVDRLQSDSLPSRSVCITFDDGYRDNRENALPVLNELGLTATFFVASGYLNDGIMFNDSIIEGIRHQPAGQLDLSHHGLGRFYLNDDQARLDCINRLLPQIKYRPPPQRLEIAADIYAGCPVRQPNDLMMTEAQVRELRDSGMCIGGHTRNHPILARLDDAQARAEIRQGKQDLEDLLGEPISVFAYPNGRLHSDYREDHVKMVRDAGFKAAVSTHHGVSSRATDLFQLARFTPWDREPWRFALRMLDNARRVQNK